MLAFHAQDLLHGLHGLRLAHPIYLYQQIDSSNEQAKRFAEGGAEEGLLVVAEEQTAGRGRAGRRWLTPPSAALAVSVVLRPTLPAAHAARLTMLAGVAVCEALEQLTPLKPQLKWPNDVLLAGRKVGGILVETAVQDAQLAYAVVGIGLNVTWAPADAEVEFPATHLAAHVPEAPSRLHLLRAILARLEAHEARLTDPHLLADWQARLCWLGEQVSVQTATGLITGRAERVAEDGALCLRLESGATQFIVAGDVRLRAANV